MAREDGLKAFLLLAEDFHFLLCFFFIGIAIPLVLESAITPSKLLQLNSKPSYMQGCCAILTHNSPVADQHDRIIRSVSSVNFDLLI